MGELRLFPYNYIPKNWVQCNGQLLSISSYPSLHSLIGESFGGNGYSNFAVPNLNGRIAVGQGNNGTTTFNLGVNYGSEQETMTSAQLPAHTHSSTQAQVPASSNNGTQGTLGFFAVNTSRGNEFNSAANEESGTISTSVSSAGSNTARNNVQPYTCLVWCMCVQGLYPARP